MNEEQTEILLKQIGTDLSLLCVRVIRLEDRLSSIEKGMIRSMK